MTSKKKVVVAMSGGVDSSVASGILLEEGYEVAGVSLRLWEGARQGPRNCSDHTGAERVAQILGIPHTLLDLRSEFVEAVVKPFTRSYLRGRTPNPCVACNRDFKLGTLLQWAKGQGADYVATGHYARISRNPLTGRASIFRGRDGAKDQSYFLFALSQDQLAHTLFPLGDLVKDEVRQRARRFGLPVADRPESQDICFGDYKALVESFAEEDDLLGGEIVDTSGKVLGRHQGIHRLTVGQRKGLGLSSPHPLYVLEIDEVRKRVIVGYKEELSGKGLMAGSVNWVEPQEEEEISVEVQLRYRSPAVPCLVRAMGDGKCEVRFQSVFPPVTPGQAAVFYRGEQVLGGGWIEKAIKY
ncbi:MAG: tRNA 2-thiouridine(34) synthase MnmA [Candidatus Binatota bacterium]